jgi:hypothetical protein
MDTHTDACCRPTTDILGEQAALTVETLRFNVLKAGTNVFYANNVAGRSSVVAAIALADQRRVTTALNRQNAKKISRSWARLPTTTRSRWKLPTWRSATRTSSPICATSPASSRWRTTVRTPRRWKVRSARSSRFVTWLDGSRTVR